MGEVALPLIAILAPYPVNHWLQRLFPRRHGTIRPATVWLALGVVLALSAVILPGRLTTDATSALLFSIVLSALAVVSVAFYFHRRIYFGRRGVYFTRFGRTQAAIPYRHIYRIRVGDNLVDGAILLDTHYGHTHPIPGLMDKRQLCEALSSLKRAGIKLPASEQISNSLGISPSEIDWAAR